MIVYRLGRTRYANDLTGEGAKLFGGRWNNKMIGCLYTSESRALALLEYTVNVNIDDIPRALSITIIEIPDHSIRILKEADLPGNWKHSPAPSSTKQFGSSLLLAAVEPVIRVPSIVIPDEYNYLLNPLHPESKKFRIIDLSDFIYDVRIKTV
ncbi:RES family NAD+ phosphorylase [Mucilaginibacter arboris]|uniref:RES domain-containing protein n=1 Tax=Mucilaginibacter arboris TaxID=2682090 RepID=A0A7K1SXR6_9SPHI|nr:RES family NAD+ phosphorylase [Mucilaginibacter arboris]MVN22103.1 RES domain-containing protein [Mucilaginibacter arboris]